MQEELKVRLWVTVSREGLFFIRACDWGPPETPENDHGRAMEAGDDGGTSAPNGGAALGQRTNKEKTEEEETPTREEDGDPGTQRPATDVPRSGNGRGQLRRPRRTNP